MYLIVGLGNPEGEYSNTRHNMGFDAINHLSQKLNITVTKEKFKALYGDGMINNEKVILLKPQTYMNLSGNSVKEVVDFYKIEKEKILERNYGKRYLPIIPFYFYMTPPTPIGYNQNGTTGFQKSLI